MISYLYLEKNMTAVDDVTAGLLMYFVKFILSPEGQALAEANLFVKLPKQLLDYNAVTLASLILPETTPTFKEELASKTLAQAGAGQYYFSGKRRSFGEYTGSTNKQAIAALEALNKAPASSLAASLRNEPIAIAGLVLACLAFVLAAVGTGIACVLCCQRNRTSKPRSIEVRNIEVPNTVTATSKADAV
jgi:hypothetical protein